MPKLARAKTKTDVGLRKDVPGSNKIAKMAEDLQKKGKRFTDVEFKPEPGSIWRFEGHYEFFHHIPMPKQFLSNKGVTPDDVQWKRPNEIGDTNADWLVFESPDPDDIKQGKVGDCYFLAALQAIATRPLLLDALIVEQYGGPGGAGIYGVKFFQMGRWETVIVDDLFPCEWDAERDVWWPIFCHYNREPGKPKEIWMMLAEKAWAKMHGSYQVIANGMVPDTMVYLTGGHRELFNFGEEETWDHFLSGHLWANLKKLKEASNKAMGTQSGEGVFLSCSGAKDNDAPLDIGGGGGDEDDDGGLIADHAYSILRMFDAKDNAKTKNILYEREPLKLIQLRNPWGSGEWTGAYGDESELWDQNPALKKAVNFVKSDDGTFWMPWVDFAESYEFFGCCITHDAGKWPFKSVTGEWKAGVSAGGRSDELFAYNPTFLLKNKSPEVVLQIEQEDIRSKAPHEMYFIDIFLNVIKKEKDESKPNVMKTVKGYDSEWEKKHAEQAQATGENADIFIKKPFRIHSCGRIKSLDMYLEPGEYYVVVTRYHPGFEGKFALNCFSDGDFDITPVAQKPDAKEKRLMAKAQVQKDPSRPICSVTGNKINLDDHDTYKVKKGVFWDISTDPGNFRCAETRRPFSPQYPFYDIGKREGSDKWEGFNEQSFKELFYPKCVISGKHIHGEDNFFQVPGGGRVLEINYVAYKLKNARSNLVCRLPGEENTKAAGDGMIPLVVKVPEDKEALKKLKDFLDNKLNAN